MDFTLEHLVEDVLILILRSLSARDILSIRQTSQRLARLSRARNIWHSVLRREVIECGFPIPDPSVSLLSAGSKDLERHAVQALCLARRWSASKPNIRDKYTYKVYEAVRQLYLLPGGRLILTVHATKLLCWDLRVSASMQCVGEWAMLEDECHVLMDTLVQPDNKVAIGPSAPIVIPTVIIGVDSSRCVDRNVFSAVGKISHTADKLVHLHGSLLGYDSFENNQEHLGIDFVDWHSADSGSALLVWPALSCGVFLGLHFHAEYVVVVAERCVALYPIPVIPVDGGRDCIPPIVVFETRDRMEHPLAFTPCWTAARGFPEAPYGHPPPLTIIARPSGRESGVVQSVLFYVKKDEITDFHLMRYPARADGKCTALRVGPSGRGVRTEEGGAVYRCISSYMLSPFGFGDSTVDFYPNVKVCDLPGGDRAQPVLDFDEGMGRLVAAEGTVVTIMDF